MSNKPVTTTPTLSEPTAPDYAVPDSQAACERFDRLVGKVVASQDSLSVKATDDTTQTMPVKKPN